MADPRFNPAGFFTFDLASGSVRSRADVGPANTRMLLLPASVLADWLRNQARGVDTAAMERLGAYLGQVVQAELSGRPSTGGHQAASELTPEAVLACASAVFGLFGWGRLELERWGAALLVVAEGVPELDPYQEATAALLSGLLSVLGGQAAACVAVDRKRFLVVSPSLAETLWQWAKRGVGLVSILERLEAAS